MLLAFPNGRRAKGEERITSLEIAELTGKPHNDVMKAIRSMEPAWERVAQGKFSLGSYRDKQNQARPCFILTKLESLFIATKFNDEARARLVLRWMELEQAEQARIQALVAKNSDDARYARRVLQSKGTLTATQIAKEMDLDV